MSGSSHWKAEDYDWDPHNMQTKKRAAKKQPQRQEAAASVSTVEDAGSEPKASKEEVPLKKEVTTSPTLGSGDETSHMQISAGDASREMPSVATNSGGNTPDDSADAPTSARRQVPVLKEPPHNTRGGPKKKIPMQCQVDGCQKDLSKEKDYYQRYRICETHLKLSSLIKEGVPQRFCQQCGRFHILADFDSDKRSCRARLNLHNNRRRKRIPNAQETPRQELSSIELRSRRTRTRRKSRILQEDSDPTDSGEVYNEPKPEIESLPSRLSRGAYEAAERPLQQLEENLLQVLDARRFPTQNFPQSLTFNDNLQVRFPPEVNASLAGFVGSMNEGKVRRSLESQSANEPLGSYHLQSISNLESESPMSMHLASQLGMELERQQRGSFHSPWPDAPILDAQEQRGGSVASRRPYLLDSTESIPGPSAAPQFRNVPAQDYLARDPRLRSSGWQGSEGHGSGLMSHQNVTGSPSGIDQAQAEGEMPSMHFAPGFALRHSSGNPAASGSPSGAMRLEPGSTHVSTIQGIQPHQQRLIVSAPQQMPLPDHTRQPSDFTPFSGPGFPTVHQTRHSDPGGMGASYLNDLYEEASHSAYRPARWSDPGTWTQHYPGMYGDGRLLSSQGSAGSSRESERNRLMRSAVKMDIPPDQLPTFMRDAYTQMTNSPSSGHMEAAIRPGCTQLIATCLTQGHQPNALEGIARLVGFDDAFWSSKDLLVQHAESSAQMKAGRVTGFWADNNHRALQPPKPQPAAIAVAPGAELKVSHPVEETGSVPARILARCNGNFLYDREVKAAESVVELPQVEDDGVLWLETETRGILSEAAAVILCRDQDVVADLQSIDDSVLLRQMPRDEVESLLVDIGMLLQYTASTDSRQETLNPREQPQGQAGRADRKPPESCCRVVLPSAEEQADQGRMTGGCYLQYITAAARRVLALCCREGWPHLAFKIMPVAAIGLDGWLDLVDCVEAFLGSNLLLHALVASASMAMLLLVLDLFALFEERIGVSGKLKGSTALHLAASLPDNGLMANLILERCPTAKSMWNSVRNSQGQSPADVAYIAYQRLTRHQKETKAELDKLCEQTEALNSPPATPRVPNTPRRPAQKPPPPPADLPAPKGPPLTVTPPGKMPPPSARKAAEGEQGGREKSRPDLIDTTMEDVDELEPDGHATVSSPATRQAWEGWKGGETVNGHGAVQDSETPTNPESS